MKWCELFEKEIKSGSGDDPFGKYVDCEGCMFNVSYTECGYRKDKK